VFNSEPSSIGYGKRATELDYTNMVLVWERQQYRQPGENIEILASARKHHRMLLWSLDVGQPKDLHARYRVTKGTTG
jgi:hypothetical protein